MNNIILSILIIIITILIIALLVWVIIRLHENFSNIDPMVAQLYANLSEIDPDVVNKITIKKAGKSFTVNKKHVNICVKDETGEYFNKNMLIYVLLHEIAHVLCKSVGHTAEFHQIFDDLLNKAEELGYYDKNIPPIQDYQDRCQL